MAQELLSFKVKKDIREAGNHYHYNLWDNIKRHIHKGKPYSN
jgi:hypothetical protein